MRKCVSGGGVILPVSSSYRLNPIYGAEFIHVEANGQRPCRGPHPNSRLQLHSLGKCVATLKEIQLFFKKLPDRKF